MTKYNLQQEVDGSFVLLNKADGTLAGYPSAVVTANRVYYLTDWDASQPTHLHSAQIYRGAKGLHAYGAISMPSEMELVTSPIRSISVNGPNGQAFEVQATDVSTTTDLILNATNGRVSIQGDYAATIFGDQTAIDAEATRLLHVRTNGINSQVSQIRMRDLGLPNGGMP